MKIHFYNKGSIDTISGGYIYNKEVIQQLRSFGHNVEYCEEVQTLSDTKTNIIDSLILNEALPHLCANHRNIGLIHLVDEKSHGYQDLELIVTGEAAKEDLIRNHQVEEKNIHVVTPGMDDEWKVKTSHRRKPEKFLCVSNFIPGKGIDLLIRVLNSINEYDWLLKIVGNHTLNPEYFKYIQALIEDFGMGERIELIGNTSREHINRLMVEADLLLNFSESETYGMAVQESIHARLPVMIYKTGAWKKFEASGMAIVLEHYSEDNFVRELKHILDFGLDFPGLKTDSRPVGRSWKSVGKEIETILLGV